MVKVKMPKKIEELTDKELEKSIVLHENEIGKDKATKYPNEELKKGTNAKEKHLKELYKERERRREKGSYFPKS